MTEETPKKKQTIVEIVARAICEAERIEGQCSDADSYVSYLPAARAAIDAYHEYIRNL